MATLSFSAQYRHPNWQRKRLEAMEAAGFSCQFCNDKDTTLNVHHKRYIKGRMIWQYGIDELIVLCEPCHQTEHQHREILARLLSEGGECYTAQITGIVAGYLEANMAIEPGLGWMAYEEREPYFELGLVAAAAECLGTNAWREVVRSFLRQYPTCPPPYKQAVARWDEADARIRESKAS